MMEDSTNCRFRPQPLRALVLFFLAKSVCVSATTLRAERHLIWQGCDDPNNFFYTFLQQIQAHIDFDSVSCVASDKEEQQAADRLRDRKISNPDIDIHMVATLLQSQNCRANEICQQINRGERYIPALQVGVRGWFFEKQPDFEALNVSIVEGNIRSVALLPDNASGGRQIAREFCRVGASMAPATIAVLYGDPNAAQSTVRIQSFKNGLEEECPDARHEVKYELYADWSATKAAATMAPLFLRDASLNAVISANDEMALGALMAARQLRPDHQLLVSGYDASPYTRPLLDRGIMFASIDQIPPDGALYTLRVLLSDQATGAVDFGSPSQCSTSRTEECGLEDYNDLAAATWSNLVSSLPEVVSTQVAIRVRDAAPLVFEEVMLLYDRKTAPLKSVAKLLENRTSNDTAAPDPDAVITVYAQLQNFKIYDVDATSSTVSGLGLLTLSWTDPRLEWSLLLYPNTQILRVDIESIWHPSVVLSNIIDSTFGRLETIETRIYPNGTVVWEQSINAARYRCGSMSDTMLYFPFDEHICGIDLTSYSVDQYRLVPATGIEEDAFDVEVTTDDWVQGAVHVTAGVDDPSVDLLEFRLEIGREPLFFILAMIIPSFLLNIISFAQFWVPAQADVINLDRGGMAVTTILASLALRESTLSTVNGAFTFLDIFMLLSLCFHFLGFLITAYESSLSLDAGDDRRGRADRLGKLYMPIVFGVLNMALAVIWNRGLWSLFWLGAVEIVVCLALSRRIRDFVKSLLDPCSPVRLDGPEATGNDIDDIPSPKITSQSAMK